jgi:hypothetical protein
MTSAFEGAEVVQAFFDRPAALPAARRRFERGDGARARASSPGSSSA